MKRTVSLLAFLMAAVAVYAQGTKATSDAKAVDIKPEQIMQVFYSDGDKLKDQEKLSKFSAAYIDGTKFLNDRKLPEAIEQFSKCLALSPQAGSINYQMGCAYLLMADSGDEKTNATKAAEYLTKAINSNPGLANAYYNRAIALYRIGYARVDDLDMAIRLNPTMADAFYVRSKLQGVLGNAEKSAADLKKYRELGGKNQ